MRLDHVAVLPTNTMIFDNHLLRDVSFEDYILRCFDFDCPPDSIVERTGLYHCLETESYWMETKSVHVKKETEGHIKTEVDPDGELLVELGGHKYPIDPEFSYGKQEAEIMSEQFTNPESTKASYEHHAIKAEPLDPGETNDSQPQSHKTYPTPAEIHGSAAFSLSTDIKSEKGKYNNYGPSHSPSGTFLKQEPSCSSIVSDRPSSFYNGHCSDQFYDGNISDQFYNSPYDCQRTKNDYFGVTSTDYQPYNVDCQMVIAQDTMTQPTSSAYCHTSSAYSQAPSAFCYTSSGYSHTSPINMPYPQTAPENEFSTRWTSAAQGLSTPIQYDRQMMVDCSRPIRKLKRGCRLWEFIRNLLMDPATNPSLIRWENRDEGTFKLMQSKTIAFMWGMKKGNRGMTYEKLSRAMRYYYRRQVFAPVLGKRLVYRFGPRAVGWKA